MLKKLLILAICFIFCLLLFASPGWIADFEDNDFSEFAGEVDTGGDLSTTNAENHTPAGTFSMLDVIDDTTIAYVYETANLTGSEIKFSFWLKLSSIGAGDWGTANQNVQIITNHTNPSQRYLASIRHNGAAIMSYFAYDPASANDTYGLIELITDTNWHKIEIHMKFDTGGTGYHKIWFDTVSKHDSAGLTSSVDSTIGMRFGDGAIGGSWDGDVSLYFDDFVDESAEEEFIPKVIIIRGN